MAASRQPHARHAHAAVRVSARHAPDTRPCVLLSDDRWGSCSGTNASNSMSLPWPARKDAAVWLDAAGYMWVSGGLNQFYSPAFSTGIQYAAYNDVWRSDLPLTNATLIAQLCQLPTPPCGTANPGVQWSVAGTGTETDGRDTARGRDSRAPPLTRLCLCLCLCLCLSLRSASRLTAGRLLPAAPAAPSPPAPAVEAAAAAAPEAP